jgi:hypothetical protein
MFAPIFACLVGCGQQVSVTIEAHAGPQAKAVLAETLGNGSVG